MNNSDTIKQKLLWALGITGSKKSGVFVFALLPTITVMALIESKLGVFGFFKSALQEFLYYSRSFWSLAFEYIDIGFSVTVFQADLFTLVSISLIAVFTEAVFYKTNLKTLALGPKSGRNYIDYFFRFAPLTLIYITIVFPNIVTKVNSPEGFVTVFVFAVEKCFALLFLILVNWVQKKVTKKPGFLNRWFIFAWLLYVTMQIASIPLDYSSRLNEALNDQAVSVNVFYYQFLLNVILSVLFLALYVLAWRLFLRVFLLLFAFLISDILVLLLNPIWLSLTEFLENFRDSGNLPQKIEPHD